MSFENYTLLHINDEGTTIRPLKSGANFSFSLKPKKDTRYRLFTTGETEQFYFWKNEPDGPSQYHTITDSLDTEHAFHDRFCLNISTKDYNNYVKRAYKKIMWPPALSYLPMTPIATEWECGIYASAKNLCIAENGFLQFRIDVRFKKDGVSIHSVKGEPDMRIILPFAEGTYENKKLTENLHIPVNTAHVGVFIEGKNYKGECFVEHPFLIANGYNLIAPFSDSVIDKPKFEWSGQNLSHKERPVMCVKLNGSTVFTGEVFERAHRRSEWEIELPTHLLKEHNTVTYELLSNYHDATPYTIYEIGIIEQPDSPVSLISASQIARVSGKARILVRTGAENTRLTVTPHSEALSGGKEYMLKEKGLHGILLDCIAPVENAAFSITTESTVIHSQIERIVIKEDDGIITGTGDAVYICQKDEDMEEYLCWYMSNHIGDLITFRPIYRWSGTKELNRPMWEWVTRLLNELEMKYVIMTDGRELPGISSVPAKQELDGAGFLGSQPHEVDGSQFYWPMSCNPTFAREQLMDLLQLAYNEDPEHTSTKYCPASFDYDGDNIHSQANRNRPHDNALCHKIVVDHLKATRHDIDIRHTGPSVTFKYFYEAGYTWVGGETMYQTMEPYMGFLRGFAKSVDMKSYGVHHAVQWSTTPHDCPEHYRRYRLALYVSYMQGATDINTEEGLWRLEEYYSHYHRFSNACAGHLKQQQDFYRYISSHTRSGAFHTPYALIHGRDDGASFFVKDMTWGVMCPQTEAEDSWELTQAIYPMSIPAGGAYVYDCPTDKPIGHYSYSPYGNADVVPVESRSEILSNYKALIFLGYNRMEKDDAKRLFEAVNNGSTLLLTRAHLTTATNFEEIRNEDLSFEQTALSFTENTPLFEKSSINGIELKICTNATVADEVLTVTDDGRPLLCKYKVGKGEVLLFNTTAYPANEAIKDLYVKQMKQVITAAIANESVWAKTDATAEFAVYNQKDGSKHIYFLAIDWYHPESELRYGTLLLNGAEYTVTMPFGVLIKCVTDGFSAAWCATEEGEVLSITDSEITVQGCGTIDFCLAKNGSISTVSVDFTNSNIKKLSW